MNRNKLFLLFILLLLQFFTLNANAQVYKIIYKETYKNIRNIGYVHHSPAKRGIAIINDSMNFYYSFQGKRDPMKKRSVPYGTYFIHHSNYYLNSKKLIYHTVTNNFSNTKNQKKVQLVEYNDFKRDSIDWILTPQQKTILGYKAKSAFGISNRYGFTDTLVVWYTEDLPFKFQPRFNLPGVLLEIQTLSGWSHLIAESITAGEFELKFPSEIKVITPSEYNEILKRRSEESKVVRISIY